jgi:hypothetical protein
MKTDGHRCADYAVGSFCILNWALNYRIVGVSPMHSSELSSGSVSHILSLAYQIRPFGDHRQNSVGN